ncbi:hypothetical protein EDD91_7866 [Streptomyces sp. KS 21]|nr:hypothetical protein EDD91_7866 [Streptomyces sp. KS 21]
MTQFTGEGLLEAWVHTDQVTHPPTFPIKENP